jgi:hypothetical protein
MSASYNTETVYYHPFYVNADVDYMYFLENMELAYDLEPISPPDKKYKSRLDICPAINVYNSHTYNLRSPVDIALCYDHESEKWEEWTPIGNTNLLIEPPSDGKPYVQLAIYFIFWTEEKTNIKLWQHDPPLYSLNNLPTWYTVPGMIPIGEYTRNTSAGFALKPGERDIRIKRGDVITSFTFVGDSRVKLVKKIPPPDVMKQNAENANRKKLCPYTLSKELFAKWLKN